jgi:hypothetical protein
VPPPGVGVKTVTPAVPIVATSVSLICVVSLVLFTNAVVFAIPFHRTVDDGTNPEPLTTRVKLALPFTTEDGESDVSTGAAFSIIT